MLCHIHLSQVEKLSGALILKKRVGVIRPPLPLIGLIPTRANQMRSGRILALSSGSTVIPTLTVHLARYSWTWTVFPLTQYF